MKHALLLLVVLGFCSVAWADEEEGGGAAGEAHAAPAGDSDHDGKPDVDADHDGKPDVDADHDGKPDVDADHDGKPDVDADHDGKPDVDADHDGKPDVDADHDGKPDVDADHDGKPDADAAASDDDDEPYVKFDADGDGKPDAELEKEYNDALAGFVEDIDPDKVDAALDARPEDAELTPSITVEQFQKIVLVVKKVVLAKLEKKMAKSSAKKMAKFSLGIAGFSLLGLFLLAIPLVVGKKYPGKGGLLFKYSALAAATFFVTVNLFGGVLYGMKTAQGALGSSTNPGLAIAAGTFDTLHDNAEEYIVMGRELFVPTLMQLEGNSDEQPAVHLIENGMKIVQDAKVFLSIAKMFKKLDVVFQALPIVLFFVTMILFGLAIRPTLTEIVKLPMRAAAGEAGVGAATTKRALSRVWGEMLATLCTIGVLTVLTLVSAVILARIVQPALEALLSYFSLAVTYLQFVEGASSGVVFLTLFGVVLFLALNLATLILSMSFFLGKSQKIFQQRFNEGTPVAAHKRFFLWGVPAVLFVQVFPLVFVFVAQSALEKINASLMAGIKDADAVPWTKIMLAGPLFLVGAYALLFWAARGFKAIGFLAGYKVKPKKASAPAQPAEMI